MAAKIESLPEQRGENMKILIIDDNPIDAELALMALRRGGVACDFRIAADERELRAKLAVFEPDLILCDFSFPGLDGFAAQRIVRECTPIPR
jgi:CheY-like chemotaxis protein